MPDQFTISIKLSPMQFKLLSLAAEDDSTFKEQNRSALSLSVKDRFGDMYSPLVEGDLQNNMAKILINLFSYSVLEGLDLVPGFDRDDLLAINAEILKGISEKENILNVIRSLSPEEKQELFQESEQNQKPIL
jgi:hypothetical protein